MEVSHGDFRGCFTVARAGALSVESIRLEVEHYRPKAHAASIAGQQSDDQALVSRPRIQTNFISSVKNIRLVAADQ